MERVLIEQLREIPPITRGWIGLSICLALLEYCGAVSFYDLLYTSELVFHKHQYWRLLTCFFYFKRLSFDLVYNLYFIYRTLRSLEETYGGDLAGALDYLWVMFVNALMLLGVSTFIKPLYLLGSSLDESLLYLWSRRNYGLRVAMFGVFEFDASYLPYASIFFTSALNGMPIWDMLQEGVLKLAAGHVFFYFADVFPTLHGFLPLARPFK